ncbi:hypothetical protein [Algoriphagus litoralis]|uniref:hypothetical protein n=1 Tax=Algoriphagus litoralis TaxID=2202829 RepID=UPI000DB97938|nr:hypothetical protein [Algoriphagus litoralis]
MESAKPNEKKRYLKAFWWIILLLSLAGVLSDGIIDLNQGYDWSFITQPKSYLKLIFLIAFWLLGFYLLLVRPKLKGEESEFEKSKTKNF